TGGELFPLESPEGLAGLLRRVATDEHCRDQLRSRGRQRSGDYSWRRVAEQTLGVYRALLTRRRGPSAPRTRNPNHQAERRHEHFARLPGLLAAEATAGLLRPALPAAPLVADGRTL